MSDLPRIFIDFNQREIDEARVVKEVDSRSWRTIILQGLSVEEGVRKVSCPRKVPLDG